MTCTLSENSDLFRICVFCFMYDVCLFVCNAMFVFEHTNIYIYVLLHQLCFCVEYASV